MDYNELLDFFHVSTLENHRFLMYAHGVCVCVCVCERKCVYMCELNNANLWLSIYQSSVSAVEINGS